MASKQVKNVVIIIAMHTEARPVVEILGLKEKIGLFPPHAPCKCYGGKVGPITDNYDVHVVTHGACKTHNVDHIGTVAASLSTWLAVSLLEPDLVINAGTAGGFKRMGAKILDTYISSDVANHDRRIDLPGFKEWGVGRHTTHVTANLRKELGYRHGNITTSNSFHSSKTDWRMMEGNDASVKDMEAAAVAWTCNLTDTPMFCVKVCTDFVYRDDDDKDVGGEKEFEKHLHDASSKLSHDMFSIVNFVLGRDIDNL